MCVKCDYKLKYKKGNKFTSYIPLHGHSTYSQGDGVTKIEDIMKRAKEVGAPGISLTEHGNMSSFYKFYKHAMETDMMWQFFGGTITLNNGNEYQVVEFE